MSFDMTVLHQTFFEEASELLGDLEGLLLRLEEEPDDSELLNTIFRCAHSIKGGSATFGFTDIATFTHSLETLLDKVRNREIPVTHSLAQILLESLDQMKALLSVARGERDEARSSEPLINRIHALINGSEEIAESDSFAEPEDKTESEKDADGVWGVWALPVRFRLHFAPGPDSLGRGGDPLLLISKFSELCQIESVRCDQSSLPALAEFEPEKCYLSWEIEFVTDRDPEELLDVFEFISDESDITLTRLSEPEAAQASASTEETTEETTTPAVLEAEKKPDLKLVKTAPSKPAAAGSEARPANAASRTDAQTLRVSTDKVDKLINLVGELIINQSMLNEVCTDFSMAKMPRLLEAVADMERACRELQERVMAIRMLPIKHAFGRFPRLVHDLAHACGKKIELKTTGEDTELDKTVIEAIADPLTDLVRNSIDHGLETPEERRAAGKPDAGSLCLHALQEGGGIIVEVSDDGRGLNRERILHKAIERGLISESDPMPTDETIYNMIFHPGFSTAPQVTDLSGRGVGMDIVKQAVQGLGGSIGLTTTPGQGTRFRIRLPLTMAILDGLSVGVGEEVYILPLTSIVESIQPKSRDIHKIAGITEVVMVRGESLPILRLYEEFGADPRFTDPTLSLLVIVENEGRKVALLVDELIGQNQAVIKSLESNYRKVEGIAGATILGDGRVALILDVPGLMRGKWGSSYALTAA